MMRLYAIIGFFMLIAACAQQQADGQQPPLIKEPEPIGQEPPVQDDRQAAPPTIVVTSAPDSAEAGSSVTITWRVDSSVPRKATHTAIHFDDRVHPGVFGTDVGPADSGYPNFTQEFASGQFDIPNTFTTTVIMPSDDDLHFRAHAIVDGKNYWTDEIEVDLPRPERQEEPDDLEDRPGTQDMSVEVEIEDFAYNPATLRISPGTTVTWKMRDTLTHTVTADDESFSSGNLSFDDEYSYTFTQAGTYQYGCDYHLSMKGTVIVE